MLKIQETNEFTVEPELHIKKILKLLIKWIKNIKKNIKKEA